MEIWDAAERAPEEDLVEPRQSGKDRLSVGTPEDVAALYTWANLQGARYRDFSASRRKYREQVRQRAAEALMAREADASAPYDAQPAERIGPNKPRPADSNRPPRPESSAPAFAARRNQDSSSASDAVHFLHSGRFRVAEDPIDVEQPAPPGPGELLWEPAPLRVAQFANEAAAEDPWTSDRWERVEEPATDTNNRDPAVAAASRFEGSDAPDARPSSGATAGWSGEALASELFEREEYSGPAWLYSPNSNARSSRSVPAARRPGEAFDESRERSGRWSALKDVFHQSRGDSRSQLAHPGERRAPLLLIVSLAGGVGKTTLQATLGRALSANGERVALGDAAAYSLLPFYFGARDLRPGAMRAFAPPEGSQDAPIFLVNYDLNRKGDEPFEQRHLMGEILRNGSECHRIILDLPATAEWLVRRIATLQPTVLVPMVPDMNSVISLEAVEQYFERVLDSEGQPVLPFYLLNQFDTSLALHLDVREVLRRRLGDRLLSFVIRRSPVVSEALAEGMTVVDYAPESPVARDYFDVASWLRTVSPPVMSGMRSARSEVR